MQDTPPVARGFMLWAVRTHFRVRLPRWSFQGLLARRCELVNRRLRPEGWTLEELQALNAEEPPVPLGPPPALLWEQARRLLDLGTDFVKVAELLEVSQEELLRTVPRVDGRVLLPSARAYSQLSAVQRLKEEGW